MTDELIKQLRERASEFHGYADARGAAGYEMKEAAAALEAANARIAELERKERSTARLLCRHGDGKLCLDTTAALAQPLEAQADARYPHAAIGAALISTGLYDRMNDITGGDREARYLIEELISKIDPILDKWHKADLSQKAGEQQ